MLHADPVGDKGFLCCASRCRLNVGMSTVDPTIARRERAERRPSNVRVVVTLILLLAGGLAAGYGWGGFGTMMATVPEEPPVLVLVAIPVGMMLAIGASIAWAALVLKRSDLGIMYGNAAVLLGAGIGVIAISAESGPVFVTTIGYGLIALAVVCLILGIAAAGARARRENADDAAMRTGTQVTALVTDKGYTMFRESDRIFTTVTFAFTDLQGTQRWVQRPMLVTAADPIHDGQQTPLWFDPANPGNDKAIVVELAHRSPLRARTRRADARR